MNKKSISQSEAKILKVLWQSSPLDGKQIAEQLSHESWSYVTIKTLINRLLTKEYLSFVKEGRRYLYDATISKKDYLKSENKQFINSLYDGSLSNLFASFSEHEKISDNELQEIKDMIKQMENES